VNELLIAYDQSFGSIVSEKDVDAVGVAERTTGWHS
jgi:hypothetical protein